MKSKDIPEVIDQKPLGKKGLDLANTPNKIPFIALSIFLLIFFFTILFLVLPFFEIYEISFFGVVIIPEDLYLDLLYSIFTIDEILTLWDENPIAFLVLIVVFFVIIYVLVKFILSFRSPASELDETQSDGSIKYFKFYKLLPRVRFFLIRQDNTKSNTDHVVSDYTGAFFSYDSENKINDNAVYCIPDKRKSDPQTNQNFFLEFPPCFDITHIRNYMSEHAWISLSTNITFTITIVLLVVGTGLNIAFNIITQAQLDPIMIFGPTSWIILGSIISIALVMIWALREIKGNYAVFRIISVVKTPLDIDRYIVIPYYWEGISSSDISAMQTALNTYLKDQTNKASLPELTAEIGEELPIITEYETNSDTLIPQTYSQENFIQEIEFQKNRIAVLDMEKERALILVQQLSNENASLKKLIRARKSIDYATQRSFSPIQDDPQPENLRPSAGLVPSFTSKGSTPDSHHTVGLNSLYLPGLLMLFIVIGLFWWFSTIFKPTEFLLLLVVVILAVIILSIVTGFFLLRHYLNDTSTGKKVNFG